MQYTLIRESTWYGVCDGDADDASFVRSEYSGIEEVIGFIRVIICIHRKEFKPESIELSIKKIFHQPPRNFSLGIRL